MRVIFTYYPYAVYYNHGACVLSSICKQYGIETFIVPMGTLFKDVFDRLKPDVVCVSYVTKHDYNRSFEDVSYVKAKGVPIYAGGVLARMGGVDHAAFNGVCEGEGELLPRFLLYGDTTIFDTKYFCEDINALPLPDYDYIDGVDFARFNPALVGKKIVPYITSRGCPYQCSFCVTKYQSKKIRIKNNIKQDMDYLYKRFQPDMFHLMDELVPYYDERWRKQIDNNLYPFFSFIRADISKDNLLFLIKNGLIACAFGVEVGDEDFRNNVLKKGITDYDIWQTVQILQDHNVRYMPMFMTGMEPDEVKWKTLDMCDEIGGDTIIWEYEAL